MTTTTTTILPHVLPHLLQTPASPPQLPKVPQLRTKNYAAATPPADMLPTSTNQLPPPPPKFPLPEALAPPPN